MKQQKISKSLIFIFIGVVFVAAFLRVAFSDIRLPYSLRIFSVLLQNKPGHKDIAEENLEILKKQYLRADGMVESEKNKTTSESQSYGMLIAVFSRDRELFDRVWDWTKNNLQIRPKDKLFSWVWQDGKITDSNPATDADQDIAYALYLAHKEWGDESYLTEAKKIVRDIWNVETKEINGTRYIAAGNWAVQDKSGVIINPSYLAPYQYRVFAIFDAEHNWLSLVDSSYKALDLCTGLAGLVMDWCKLDNKGNVVRNYKFSGNDSTIYSYDALRVPYRIATDYSLNKDPRALAYLKQQNTVFAQEWKNKGKIFAAYNQEGVSAGANESLASYGAQLASMSLTDEVIAKEIFEKKIATISFWENIGFYDMSWLWFGLRFYANELRKNKSGL